MVVEGSGRGNLGRRNMDGGWDSELRVQAWVGQRNGANLAGTRLESRWEKIYTAEEEHHVTHVTSHIIKEHELRFESF